MTHPFSFQSSQHDFWEIYEAIRKYYPIGIHRGEKGIYFEYPGIKELERIVVENTHDQNNFRERWVNFSNQIGEELHKEMEGSTYGQAPSFSSSVILQRNKIGNCMHTRALNFSVSLIGNFYQIYGTDTTTIFDQEVTPFPKGYMAINVVTVSPFEEFADSFILVEQMLQERYPNYKIIPFSVGQAIIRGLQVSYLEDEDCSINKALFNHFLSEENISRSTRGDSFYGREMWRKKDSIISGGPQ